MPDIKPNGITRRAVLSGAAAGFATLPLTRAATAKAGNFMPAEWAPHARCIMALCSARGAYTGAQIARIRSEQATIAKAIAGFETVTMLINKGDEEDARKLLGPAVEIIELDHFDVWTRDTLPSFVRGIDGVLTAVDWQFNVWGETYPEIKGYDRDRTLARRFAEMIEAPVIDSRIVAEGGGIETDGEGTLITTESCLLDPKRNRNITKVEIETELKRLTGATKVIWLVGSAADAITNGHIDGIAKFARPGLVIAEVSDDPQDPEFLDLSLCARQLEQATDARGRSLEVVKVRRPRWDRMPARGDDFAASYINCYLANGAVVMAKFGDAERDNEARELFEALYRGRKAVQLSVDEICEGGGGIHCNTQQIPLL